MIQENKCLKLAESFTNISMTENMFLVEFLRSRTLCLINLGEMELLFQRKHQNFLQDLSTLQSRFEAIQEVSAKLQAAYAGGKAKEITNREREVVRVWMEFQAIRDSQKSKLNDTGNLFRFFAMVRNLMLWMDNLMRSMSTSEKPRDVSGVELLMNNHQEHKAGIDAREDNRGDSYGLGNELLSFNAADREFGLVKLLDAEDVFVDTPEEKSIIAHVVTYYHYSLN